MSLKFSLRVWLFNCTKSLISFVWLFPSLEYLSDWSVELVEELNSSSDRQYISFLSWAMLQSEENHQAGVGWTSSCGFPGPAALRVLLTEGNWGKQLFLRLLQLPSLSDG
jgi:hypothetical protein